MHTGLQMRLPPSHSAVHRGWTVARRLAAQFVLLPVALPLLCHPSLLTRPASEKGDPLVHPLVGADVQEVAVAVLGVRPAPRARPGLSFLTKAQRKGSVGGAGKGKGELYLTGNRNGNGEEVGQFGLSLGLRLRCRICAPFTNPLCPHATELNRDAFSRTATFIELKATTTPKCQLTHPFHPLLHHLHLGRASLVDRARSAANSGRWCSAYCSARTAFTATERVSSSTLGKEGTTVQHCKQRRGR
jgi:hypothetical protein